MRRWSALRSGSRRVPLGRCECVAPLPGLCSRVSVAGVWSPPVFGGGSRRKEKRVFGQAVPPSTDGQLAAGLPCDWRPRALMVPGPRSLMQSTDHEHAESTRQGRSVPRCASGRCTPARIARLALPKWH